MTVLISGSTPEPQLAQQLVKCQHNNLRPMTTPPSFAKQEPPIEAVLVNIGITSRKSQTGTNAPTVNKQDVGTTRFIQAPNLRSLRWSPTSDASKRGTPEVKNFIKGPL